MYIEAGIVYSLLLGLTIAVCVLRMSPAMREKRWSRVIDSTVFISAIYMTVRYHETKNITEALEYALFMALIWPPLTYFHYRLTDWYEKRYEKQDKQ